MQKVPTLLLGQLEVPGHAHRKYILGQEVLHHLDYPLVVTEPDHNISRWPARPHEPALRAEYNLGVPRSSLAGRRGNKRLVIARCGSLSRKPDDTNGECSDIRPILERSLRVSAKLVHGCRPVRANQSVVA